MITAPYNFVPLNEKVFFPDWAEDVSHDTPFEDTQSGVIDITLTAKSPVFVRDAQNEQQFCNYKGDHYIPSTSVKGMIRSIFEILTFSKLTSSSYNDSTYSVRDLNNKDLYMSQMTPDKILCGWLKKVGNEYFIEDCGKPGRIKHSEIDQVLSIDFASKFKAGTFKNKAEHKTATKKYALVDLENLTHHFKFLKKDVNRDIYEQASSADKKGTIVLTGQPSARKEPAGSKPGKVYEFIFFEKLEDIKLNELVYENFKFAYFDDRTTEPKESPDWTFWKKELNAGGKVPVFFQKKGEEVKHFGLSYLYKLPYSHSVKDGVFEIHNNIQKDMTQTLFGAINKSENQSLKGRVQFTHFKATSDVKTLPLRTEILGTPRASYYPIYVKQKGKLYTTFMDNGFEIAGRKRYPIHKSSLPSSTEDTGNSNVGTKFSPLNTGIIFQGKLRYHNLKRVELGALISSLTFHNTPDTFHNIGLAKSLGYGKMKVEISTSEDTTSYLKEFEMLIKQTIPDWNESTQLKELFSMASEQENAKDSLLQYMKLEGFRDNKKRGDEQYLKNYTELTNIKSMYPATLITKDDLKEIEERKELMLFEEEMKKILASDNLQVIENFINKNKDKHNTELLQQRYNELSKAQESNKHQKLNDEAQKAWEGIHDPKYIKGLQKSLQSFIKKWERRNKGSEFILELIEKAKQEQK